MKEKEQRREKKDSLAKQHPGGGGGVFLNIYNSGLISAEPVEKVEDGLQDPRKRHFSFGPCQRKVSRQHFYCGMFFSCIMEAMLKPFLCSTCKRHHCCYSFLIPPVHDSNQVEIRLIDFFCFVFVCSFVCIYSLYTE